VTESPAAETYVHHVQSVLQTLGIAPDLPAQRQLVLHPEPETLVVAHTGANGRDFLLTPEAGAAWLQMQAQAAADGISLALVSAFRSVARQQEIILSQLAMGHSIESILASVAPPGYSEHHTGRAIDIGTSETDALEEIFETTAAFKWLQNHANAFDFYMSYPRNNWQGFVFEPWHWCYTSAQVEV
jgi:D-alanyl-D-alanine carboxypeptidase